MPTKLTRGEVDNYTRQVFEKLRNIEGKNRKDLTAEEKHKIRELHFMKCPKCGMKLAEVDYRHLQVDKCTACEGIWLDAGELEQVARLDKGGLDRFFSVFLRDK